MKNEISSSTASQRICASGFWRMTAGLASGPGPSIDPESSPLTKAGMIPARTATSVLFPLPLGPVIAAHSPAARSRFSRSRTNSPDGAYLKQRSRTVRGIDRPAAVLAAQYLASIPKRTVLPRCGKP